MPVYRGPLASERGVGTAGDGYQNTIDAVTLDDSPTTTTGAAVDLGFRRRDARDTISVRVEATKVAAPTNLQFFLEFSDDSAFTNVWVYDEDGWAARIVGAGSISGTYRRVWKAPIQARFARLRAAATGSDADNRFTVSAWIAREW